MKFPGKLNSVFHRLIFSYCVLVLLTALIISTASFMFFSSNFNREIIKVNQKMINHINSYITLQIIENVENIYLELVNEGSGSPDLLTLFDYPSLEGNSTVKGAYVYLNRIVSSNNELLKSINIYLNKPDVILSSSGGVKFVNGHLDNITINTDWVSYMNNSPSFPGYWIGTREVYVNKLTKYESYNILSYVRTYPFYAKVPDSKGFISIDIKEEAFYNLIMNSDWEKESGEILILNEDGKIISHSKKNLLYSSLKEESYVKKILLSSRKTDNFMDKINGERFMISFGSIENTGWKIVNITPVNRFYEKSYSIRKNLVLISIVTLFLGLLLANVFTNNIYNPLKPIMKKVNKLFSTGPQQAQKDKNEYTLINRAINSLSFKVSELESTISDNIPLIKHNLVTGLLTHTIKSKPELDERLGLLQIKFDKPCFNCAIFEIGKDFIDTLSVQNNQFLKLDLIRSIENPCNPDFIFTATELTNYKIVTVFNYTGNYAQLLHFIKKIVNRSSSEYMMPVTAAIGSMQKDQLMLEQSYSDAQAVLKYKFFLPNQAVLEPGILLRENNMDEIPDKLADDFNKSLRLGNLAEAERIISTYVEYTQTGIFSANHCHQILLEFLHVFSSYLKDINLNTVENTYVEIMHDIKSFNNIVEFKNKVLEVIGKVLINVNNKKYNYNKEIITRIKDHISKNLSGDLSLEAIAGKVFLNPSYLSKMFKDITGTSFIEYVISQKLEKAKELILTTDLNIEEIAHKTGYNTHHHFTKQFRKVFGVTPKELKRSTIKL